MSSRAVPMASPDNGSVYQVAICTNCSREIVLMPASKRWLHDNTGWQRCDGLPDSTPGENNDRLSIV